MKTNINESSFLYREGSLTAVYKNFTLKLVICYFLWEEKWLNLTSVYDRQNEMNLWCLS